MVDKQVTIMVLKVDLKCHLCYKKIKKVLCKFPQIQDQMYDERQNTVTIKVVCCCPEKIKQKIICKAGDCLESIVIVVPQEPKPEHEPQPKPDKGKKKKKNKKPGGSDGNPNPDGNSKDNQGKESTGKKSPGPVSPVVGYPVPNYGPGSFRTCCKECYEGRPGGPCTRGQGGPPPCYPYGRPVCECYYGPYGGCRRGCYLVHYEETTSGTCLVM